MTGRAGTILKEKLRGDLLEQAEKGKTAFFRLQDGSLSRLDAGSGPRLPRMLKFRGFPGGARDIPWKSRLAYGIPRAPPEPLANQRRNHGRQEFSTIGGKLC